MRTALFPLVVELRRSPFLVAFRRLYGTVLLCLLATVAWPMGLRVSVCGAVLIVLVYAEVLQRQQPSIRHLHLFAKGELEILDGQAGENAAAVFLPERYRVTKCELRHPRLVIFCCQSTMGRSLRLAVPWDACEPEHHRRLRVWLNWEASFPMADLVSGRLPFIGS